MKNSSYLSTSRVTAFYFANLLFNGNVKEIKLFMKLLKTIKHSDLFTNDKVEVIGEYKIRKAARAVVFDDDGKIAIIKVVNHNYHKLPGGGVEEGDDLASALEREMVEEIGCKILVTGDIGRIIEYRDRWGIKQESFCYIAKLVGEKGQPEFTEVEIADGFVILWISLEEAIEKIRKDKPDDYLGKLVQARDRCFLEEARILQRAF